MSSYIKNFSFLIISPEPNFGRFKSTLNSIKANYKNTPIVCTLPKTNNPVDEYRVLTPTYQGGNTLTSLINLGIKKSKTDWVLLVIEGTWVKPNIDKKYSKFMTLNKEIFFPIVCDYDIQGKITKIYQYFWECSLNGILFNKKAFEEIGDISNGNLNDVRLSWCCAAQEKGWLFKGILGTKIC